MHAYIISWKMKGFYKDYWCNRGCAMIFACMHMFISPLAFWFILWFAVTCCPGNGHSRCCVAWLGTIQVSCLVFAYCLYLQLGFLVMWQWGHLQFCSLCSCVLHIFKLLVVLSLVLAYALVLYMVVFHGLQGVTWGHLYLQTIPLLAPVSTMGKLCLVMVTVQGAPPPYHTSCLCLPYYPSHPYPYL